MTTTLGVCYDSNPPNIIGLNRVLYILRLSCTCHTNPAHFKNVRKLPIEVLCACIHLCAEACAEHPRTVLVWSYWDAGSRTGVLLVALQCWWSRWGAGGRVVVTNHVGVHHFCMWIMFAFTHSSQLNLTMPTPKLNTQAAPYGYTATGRIRKKPLKSSVPLLVQNQNPYEKWRDNRIKFQKCPACFKNFSHRLDSHIAVWQQFLHFTTKDPKHQEVHDAFKKIRDQMASGMYSVYRVYY